MKNLLLYGMNCDVHVWDRFLKDRNETEWDVVEYPHDMLEGAQSIQDITKWVYDNYKGIHYDAIIAHSMGGILALQLALEYAFDCDKIIFIETNLKPAAPFYRNLMTPENMQRYGEEVTCMLQKEAPFYSDAIRASLQDSFDYTSLVRHCPCPVYAIYGDRGQADYENRYQDLCLDENTLEHMDICFVENSCHMPMIENPEGLNTVIHFILDASIR